jgi:lysophospholipase L1-like esterase/glucose/arabinose dehydrogenase/plastocyanin
MIRTLFLLLLAAAGWPLLAAPTSLVLLPPGGAKPVAHVVLVSGDEEYRGEEALPMLAKILSQRHGFKCTVLFALDADGTINPDNQKSLPDAAALETADVIVMALRFRVWPDEAMTQFVRAFERGVPLVALRTSTHPFNFPAGSRWNEYSWNRKDGRFPGGFGKAVLGETWVSHWGRHKVEATRTVVEPGAATSPLLRGVQEIFGDSDVYEAYPPADATVLLRGLVLKGMKPGDEPADYRKKRATDKVEQAVNAPPMPVAWTRLHRHESGVTNRVFCTTLGAATDLLDEDLRRLVVNAVFWGLDRPVPASADVRVVDPYRPLMYGFKAYRLGLTPADYGLGREVPPGLPRPSPTPPPPPAPKAAVAPAPVTPAAVPVAANVTARTAAATTAAVPGTGFQFNLNDRVALIGNGLADRMQHHGWLETMIHARHPLHQISVRNLAVAGDEVVDRARSKDFGTPDDWLTKVQADVVFAFFGYNEAFAGPEGLPRFREILARFIQETRKKSYNGLGAPRLVVFSPIAVERHPDPNVEYKPELQANLAAYTRAMSEICRDQAGVTFVDLFTPSQELFAEAARTSQPPLTINGVHLNEAGEGRLAARIYPALMGAAAPDLATPEGQALRAAVNKKNTLWHGRYRTVDGYNVYGDRSKIAYVSHPDLPKITNTQIMMEEMAQRDVMTVNQERRVWALAAGKTGPVDMLPLPVVTAFGTNKPGPNIDGTYPFIDGDEAVSLMTLAPGLKANLFASEKQFPELAKAVQMNFDTRGRLWVAVWPSYPELTPTARVTDKIIILEDTNRDGRADTCTTFLDGLNCPTGFQFFKDGILLMQAPDLWFVRDTNGDGRGDWKERVLMGLDSADSHHTANSLIYEPGGAILLSDGVFHRSQVETVNGVVRNIDGAIYRYEPLTARFETYVPYAFANPHGRAFDYWGNDLITDATGNNTYFGPAFSGKLDFPAKHPRMREVWTRPSRPSAGSTILTSTHFPEEYWGDYLNPNVIGFQGIFRVELKSDGSGLTGTREPDVVQSKDPNFRPIDTATGPDGALYVIDWHNPLIGHLQSHLRDSNRDHVHGRIYRITYEGRPLVWQPVIDGAPIPDLLELLKRKENQIRNLAKIELGKRDSAQVIAATKAWERSLIPTDPDFAHHQLEALWVHQWHNQVDLDLLGRVLRSARPEARAAAVRVLCYWRDRFPGALTELRRLVDDSSPRVRLQVVRAASFFPSIEAAEVALAATRHDLDYYLDYIIGETLRQHRPLWRESLAQGRKIASGDPASLRYLLRLLSTDEVIKLPRTVEVAENLVGRPRVPDAVRAEALDSLSKQWKRTPVSTVLTVLDGPGEFDAAAVGKLLLAQPPEALRAERSALLKLAQTNTSDSRSHGWAALALADNSLDRVWSEAAGSPLSLQSLLGAIVLIPNPTLRAGAYERVMPFLSRPVTDFQGPDQIVAATQRDAMRAVVSTRREPAAVFAALAGAIERGVQISTAAREMRSIPRPAWGAEPAARAARALVAWASRVPAGERTRRDYVDTIQVADDLIAVMTSDDAAGLRQTIRGLRVPVFVIRTVVEEMRYDTPRIVAPLGRPIEIIFENPDVMPHNLVVVKPGSRERLATAALGLPPEHLDRAGRAWVPESRDLVAATKLLETGQSETLRLPAFTEEGVYEYVCTFPGHWFVMWGQLVVTAKPDALPANLPPAPSPPAATAAPAHAAHGH